MITKTKKGNILLTVNREGEFGIRPGNQDPLAQCGFVGKDDTYRYKVSITATNKKLLEPFGFVIDNADVHDYFVDRYENGKKKCVSCELMACDAIDHFFSLFHAENAPCKGIELVAIEVTIHGSSHSFITAKWSVGAGTTIK